MTDPLLKLALWGPAFPLVLCSIQYKILGHVPDHSIRLTIFVIVFCLALAAFTVWLKRKTIHSRLYLNVKPNVIEVEGGEVFAGAFSSDSRFLVDRDEFYKTVRAVGGRKSHTHDRFMTWREAVYVRIWPGALGITELELEAVAQTLAEEFTELEIEVMDTTPDGSCQDTAIKA